MPTSRFDSAERRAAARRAPAVRVPLGPEGGVGRLTSSQKRSYKRRQTFGIVQIGERIAGNAEVSGRSGRRKPGTRIHRCMAKGLRNDGERNERVLGTSSARQPPTAICVSRPGPASARSAPRAAHPVLDRTKPVRSRGASPAPRAHICRNSRSRSSRRLEGDVDLRRRECARAAAAG